MPPIITIPLVIGPAIQPQSYSRNGQVAPVNAMTALARATNQTMRWRGKELFTSPGTTDSVAASAGAGPTTIWRSYIHTGPFVDTLRFIVELQRPSSGSTGTPSCTVAVTTTGGAAVDSETVYHGYGTAGTVDTWSEFTGTLAVSADTDYLLVFTVSNNARLANGLVYEETLLPTAANGYIDDGMTNTSPIFDATRAAIQSALYKLGRRGCAVVMDWYGARANGTATDTNIFDGSSTAVSASTPGVTLDMRYKARLKDAAAGVPCEFRVFGSVDAGTAGDVKIKDSGGTALATVSSFTTTPSWKTASLVLPATKAKYDITLSTAAATLHISDVAIYEYQT